MKWHKFRVRCVGNKSLPVRGAWVEIMFPARYLPRTESLPVRGAWVEM